MNPLKHLLACLTFLVMATNLIFWLMPLTLAAIVKYLIGARLVQRSCNRILEAIYRAAVLLDSFWLTKILRIQINAEGMVPDHPAPIVVSNHQSWFDILVVQHLITGGFYRSASHKSYSKKDASKKDASRKKERSPIVKFLVKRELLWLPIIGWICYALHFPRLHRGQGTGARQRDYAAIETFSSSLQDDRGALLIFAEGTRFSEAKRRQQPSPYQHLLNPKPGGLKIALGNTPAETPVLDLTIIYHGDTNFWRCLYGNTRRVSAFISETPAAEIADARAWLKTRWQAKDNFQGWHDRC